MRLLKCPRVRARRLTDGPAAAFTLVELLATVGIMILVLSVTIVAFTPMLRRAGVKSAVRTLRSSIDAARVRAIQQRRPIRFEARVLDLSTHQWRVTSSAGDLDQEWDHLPEFVALSTNADGRGIDDLDDFQSLSITFAPDGSVKRVAVNDTVWGNLQVFAIRLNNMRQASEEENRALYQVLVIIPLTGGIQSYDAEGETL